MPVDALIQLQASVTKTATFNGAALSLPGGSGTPRNEAMFARVIYSAAANASGANTVTFSVDVSYNSGSSWASDFVGDPAISLSTTAQSGELFIPFVVNPTVVSGVITAPQIRLTATFAGAGTSPTITYQGDISLTKP